MTTSDEWTPSYRLEIGTNDEEQVVVTIEAMTHGEWRCVDIVRAHNLTVALSDARKVILSESR